MSFLLDGPAWYVDPAAILTAFGAGMAAAAPTAPPTLSIVDSLLHDASTALTLTGQQLALPVRIGFGFPILLGVLTAAVLIAWPVRLWMLARLSAFLNRSHRDTELAIYAKAVAAVILTTALLLAAGQIALAGLDATLQLLPGVRSIARTVAVGIAIAGFGLGIGRALRSADDKSRRPIQMPAGLGRAIGIYPFAAGIMLGLTAFIDQTSRILQATTTSWTIAQGLLVLAEAILIARFLLLAGHARERQIERAATGDGSSSVPAVFGMTALAWGALALGCTAFVFGHTRFAMVVLQELLWAALILTTAWLLTRFLDALVARLLDTDRRAGRFATTVVGVRQARVTQAALLGSAIFTMIVWVFAIGLILAPLQGEGTAVVEQVRPNPLFHSLQALNVSPRSIVMALVVLTAGIALTRLFRGWLENRFLPSTALDVGARTSIVTGLSYFGIIIAMLSATNTLGVQLEKITLIASALSVGIGFGLQSIIQNFVSGLILLIERPVKLGDWVSVSGAEGRIQKIRVRATELATADGGVSIVPNSAFISSTVANRADPMMAQRLNFSMTVSGCGSAIEARDLLRDKIDRSRAVRVDPAPRLYLRTLGDGEWGFDVTLYGKPDASVAQTRSDILFSISEQMATSSVSIKLS